MMYDARPLEVPKSVSGTLAKHDDDGRLFVSVRVMRRGHWKGGVGLICDQSDCQEAARVGTVTLTM